MDARTLDRVTSTRALLAEAVGVLAEAGVPSPQVDAELLLAHVTGRTRVLLRLHGGDLDEEAAQRYRALVDERARRTPLQHLTGTAPFRHLQLRVGPGVFIPRPETELIVDAVLAHAGLPAGPADGRGWLFVDLCSGSAALALSLATEAAGSRVVAVELSEEALAWAEVNVAEHAEVLAALGSGVDLVAADAARVADADGPLADLRGRVDVVVSNPPYVPEDAVPREPEVRDHDPAVALYGGPDGLSVIRPLAVQAAALLRPGGLLLVEHADTQGEAAGARGVPALLRAMQEQTDAPVWRDVADRVDLAGLPRFTTAVRAAGRMAP